MGRNADNAGLERESHIANAYGADAWIKTEKMRCTLASSHGTTKLIYTVSIKCKPKVCLL